MTAGGGELELEGAGGWVLELVHEVAPCEAVGPAVQGALFDTGELDYVSAVERDLAVFDLWAARLEGDEVGAARAALRAGVPR